MTEVLVVAAYPLVRAGLRAVVGAAEDLEVVGEAASLAEVSETLAAGAAPVVLADLGALPPDELAEVGTLAREAPELGLVLLVAPGSERALPAPARGRVAYLPREATAETIVAAVRAVALGLTVVDPAAVPGLLAGAPRPAVDVGAEPLTARELEVLALLAQGLPNKQIAQRLGISEHTVKFHVGAILAKLGAASRTEAVTLAARQGLLLL
ncbi:MAG: response regulator transcription factor [Chloroflexi bacterium]|nr:response regulator transcription factor [Chloroflexota bacterium]